VTKVRALALTAIGVTFVRNPRYLADEIAGTVYGPTIRREYR
jgi:hypothetical protein